MSKHFREVGPASFPDASGLNVNMLPFINGEIDLVSKTVGLWFSKHSTMNPKVDPACPVTDVDKFRCSKIS